MKKLIFVCLALVVIAAAYSFYERGIMPQISTESMRGNNGR